MFRPIKHNSFFLPATLVFVPILVLTAIAIWGMREYRHAITAQAEAIAQKQADRISTFLLNKTTFEQHAESKPLVILYKQVPDKVDSTITDAWRQFKTGKIAANTLADLIIDQSPSAISSVIVDKLQKRHPNTDFAERWRTSELRRKIANQNLATNNSEFLQTTSGIAFVKGHHVLLPFEITQFIENTLRQQTDNHSSIRVKIDGHSIGNDSPIHILGKATNHGIAVTSGIPNKEQLFTFYRKVQLWLMGIISTSALSTFIGLALAWRSFVQERYLNTQKSQFVASVSHELRTPIASIRLMADALYNHSIKGAKATEFHRLISSESSRLSNLINNILDYSVIEKGSKDFDLIDTDLSLLIADSIAIVEPIAKQRNISFQTQIQETTRTYFTEPESLQQAIVNVLDNAIKFSPNNETIEVILCADDQSWTLTIADNGPGIPKHNRNNIFHPFVRLEDELTRETKGVGLGLTIVKNIVEAHNGGIQVIDSEVGTKIEIQIRSK